jgi:hypothetical protein
MSLQAAVRHTIAMIALGATLFVGFGLALGAPPWTPEIFGFATIFTVLIGPLALIALALDAAFFQTDRGFVALNVAYSFKRIRLIAPLAFAILGFGPIVGYGLGQVQRSSGWLLHAPIWIAVLVHRAVMAWPRRMRLET